MYFKPLTFSLIKPAMITRHLRQSFGGQNTLGKDSNKDEGINHVPTPRLLDIILDWRSRGNILNERVRNASKSLDEIGLEDPFENRKTLVPIINILFKLNHDPKSEMAKALLIFRSVIPRDLNFTVKKVKYSGLPTERGGMEIRYDDNQKSSLRRDFPALLPKDYFSIKPEARIAVCQEYTHLLISLLQAAGIRAEVGGRHDHAFAIAKIGDKYFKLDAAIPEFSQTTEKPISRREAIALHYSNKGYVLLLHDRSEEAMEAFEIAIEIDPRCYTAWHNKGYGLEKQGEPDKALDAYKKAAELKETYETPFKMGQIYFQQERFREAIDALNLSLKINPDYVYANILRGRALIQLGMVDEGIKAFDRALEFNPKFALAWFMKGRVFAQQNEWGEAINAFRQAVRINKKYAAAWYFLGQALGLSGAGKEAKDCYERARKLGYSHEKQ